MGDRCSGLSNFEVERMASERFGYENGYKNPRFLCPKSESVNSGTDDMQKSFIDLLNKLLNIGVTDSDIKLAQKIRQLNLLISIAVITTIIYASIYVFLLKRTLPAQILIIFFVLYLFSYWFSARKKIFRGKIWLFTVYLVHIFLYSAILFSKSSGFHFFFFILPPVVILLFNRNELVPKIVFTLLAALLFFLSEIMPDLQFSISISATENLILYYISIITCFCGLIVVTGSFDHEITDLEQKLSHLATVDPLTQVYNRRQLYIFLESQFSLSQRYHTVFSTILVDIDFFKKVNDTYGHKCGDEALVWVARNISDNIRGTDFIARYGGEEFCIVLPKTGEKAAYTVSEKLRSVIEKHPFRSKSGHVFPLTISCGVCTLSRAIRDYTTMIHYADTALYQAKENGRNRTEACHLPL